MAMDPQTMASMGAVIAQALAQDLQQQAQQQQDQACMLQTIVQTMNSGMQQMLNQVLGAAGHQRQPHQIPVGGQPRATGDRDGYLPSKDFKTLAAFDGKESKWVEWHTKFTGIVGERSPVLLEALKWAATQEDIVTVNDVELYWQGNVAN